MKNTLKVLFAVVAVGGLILNLSFTHSNKSGPFSDTKLNNIAMVQASAGEWNCDGSNTNCCTYTGFTGSGILSYKN
jgi:hypothetical protein